LKLTALKRHHVEELYGTLGQKISAAMVKKVGVTLGVALGKAVDKGMIPFNPTSRVKKPKSEPPEIPTLNPDQVSVFLAAAADDRLYGLYALGLDSGMRPGELFGLQWTDFDFRVGSVTVRRALAVTEDGSLALKPVKTGKKGERTILLTPFTLEVLEGHRKRMLVEGNVSGPVFCNSKGGFLRLSDVHRASFKPLLKRAGLPDMPLYSLRHSCATLLLLAGQNVKSISERLGHCSVTLTLATYSHVVAQMQQEAAARMHQILTHKPALAANGLIGCN
jgi:integrase